MNPKKQILKYIQNAHEDINQSGDAEQRETPGSNGSRKEILQELFDGMSSGTARIVIEQELNRSLDEKFDIEQGGAMIGKAIGPRDWDSTAAKAFFEYLIEYPAEQHASVPK